MNDLELISQIRNGNPGALRFLVDKHKNLVWYMVLRMTNQQEDAEDLCQEVFLRMIRDVGKFRGDSKLSSWIGSIAYNVCVDFLRKKGRMKVFPTDNLDAAMAGKSSPDRADGDTDRATLKRMVHEAISRLPLNYRAVITLYHLEEMSYREISEIMVIPEGTVKSYISRAREMIRQEILKRVPDIHPVLFET